MGKYIKRRIPTKHKTQLHNEIKEKAHLPDYLGDVTPIF
jgi:hypothetical protein